MLELEVSKNPHPHRRSYVDGILAKADRFVSTDEPIIARAKQLESEGFKGMDAMHIASAEVVNVQFFCSCDDRLLRKARVSYGGVVKIVSPFELVEELI